MCHCLSLTGTGTAGAESLEWQHWAPLATAFRVTWDTLKVAKEGTLVMRQIAKSLLNAVRGFFIGVAEIVPGVSGGTIALIVGVYTTLIDGAASVVRGILAALSGAGVSATVPHFRAPQWSILMPVLMGMVGGIFIGAWVLEPVLGAHPVQTRAVFAGLILASLWVPIRMVGKAWRWRWGALGLLAAVASFALTSLPPIAGLDGSLWLVAPAAAIAVCALVLPGVSGSFILVVLGMYEPTLAAVNDRDFGYLGIFVLGAILGVAVFVRVLQWLLTLYRTATLVVMTGLMLGSLRALWPWQGESGHLLAPETGSGLVWMWALGGAALVVLVLGVERLLQSRVKNDVAS
jgi:putative membrane protein